MQQLAVVRRLAADFNVPVKIVGVETVREPDGLALSSRNQRLSADERRLAPALFRALQAAAAAISAGERNTAAVLDRARKEIPADPALRLEYLDVVDADEMQPVAHVDGDVRVAGALWVGGTRLIDNVPAAPEGRNRTSRPA
jgi:pantoate--beta-alanine ligase